MDYEKKYKEALERARQFSEKPYLEDSKGIVDYIFPELKESEDERIRKEIITFIVTTPKERNNHKKWIAWLEAQGEHDNFRNKIQVGDKVTRNEDGVLVNLSQLNRVAKKDEKQGNNMGISEATKQKLEDNLNKALEKETPEYWNEFLDEQGEQKYIPKYKIGDYVKDTNYKGEPIYEIVYMDKECYICEYRGKERMGDKAVMHFSFDNPYLRLVQKPADKVEPKFKVGDTIYYNSFGELKSMIVANVVTDSTDNPMYEDKEGNAVFEKDLIEHKSVEVRTTGYWNVQDIEQKPAWSEEDEDILNTIINHFKIDIECTDEDDTVRWLKSLKDRYAWKPSELQIEALESATENCAYSEYQNCLRELAGQLKKLKE